MVGRALEEMVHCFGALCFWEYHAFLLVLCQCFGGGCDVGRKEKGSQGLRRMVVAVACCI